MKTFLKTRGFPEMLAKWAQEQITNTRNGGKICQILIWGFAIPSRQSPREKKTNKKQRTSALCLPWWSWAGRRRRWNVQANTTNYAIKCGVKILPMKFSHLRWLEIVFSRRLRTIFKALKNQLSFFAVKPISHVLTRGLKFEIVGVSWQSLLFCLCWSVFGNGLENSWIDFLTTPGFSLLR